MQMEIHVLHELCRKETQQDGPKTKSNSVFLSNETAVPDAQLSKTQDTHNILYTRFWFSITVFVITITRRELVERGFNQQFSYTTIIKE